MPLISWPATLPAPMLDGYKVRPGEAITRTDMDSGPARQRREFTQVSSKVTARWRFRNDQMALFEAWYQHKADEGGEWFTIPLLCGLGLEDHEARFTKQYDAPKRANGGWFVDAELEVRKRPILSEAELDVLLDSDLLDLQAAVGALDTLANVTLFPLMGA